MEDTSKYPDINKTIDHLFRNEAGKMVVVVLMRLFGFANIEQAEDIVQDTILKALHIDDHTTKMTFQNKGNPTGFSKLLAPFMATSQRTMIAV